MWLQRHTHDLITFASKVFYRFTVAGEPVPVEGPVLLVSNHQNSLLDASLVSQAAGRPVRYLARAPLFQFRSIGWLIRASGAIPVYRKLDDPNQMDRNRQMFSAAWEALHAGDAVGVFPEGLSHSEPSLAPVKTGAARIALGAARLRGGSFPILPVGLTFRGGKERFHSEPLVLVGKPIRWNDLMPADEESPGAVRALTQRIEAGLARVTVNLDSWDDFPRVETAEAIHNAEFGKSRPHENPVRWLARMRRTADALRRARAERPHEFEPLEQDLIRHARVLETLGLQPADLHEVPKAAVAARWTIRNVLFFGLALPLAVIGWILFIFPHLLVTRAEDRLDLPPDRRATYLVLAGTAAYGGWILLIAAGLREFVGWRPALGALGLLPLLGILTLRIRDRWRAAVADLRRILLLKGRNDLRTRLLERQRDLAERIRELQRTL